MFTQDPGYLEYVLSYHVVLLRSEDIKMLESEIAEIDAGQARRPLVSACSCIKHRSAFDTSIVLADLEYF